MCAANRVISSGSASLWPDRASPLASSCYKRAVEQRVRIEIFGRPATFATAHERPWKEAIRAAVEAAGITPQVARWGVSIEFRTPPPCNVNDVWDIDNLIKPTLDA